MTRRRWSTRARAEVFAAHGGACHVCNGKITVGEAWDIEHIIPLAQGGADDATNVAPAHVKCHRAKTAKDAGDTAKAKRREAKHKGFYRPRAAMPGSKASGWRKRVDGTVERRGE